MISADGGIKRVEIAIIRLANGFSGGTQRKRAELTMWGTRNKSSEAELEDRWRAFDEEAMPQLPHLFRVALWLVRDHAQAEDLVQETLMQALQSFHRFTRGSNCRAWLVTILYHTKSKRRRGNMRLQLVSDVEERIAETVAYDLPTPQNLTDEEVLQALERIPRQFQEVVLLTDVEELSYKEVAQMLSIPIGTVMSRLSRGRKLLRVELAQYANAHGIGQQRAERS